MSDPRPLGPLLNVMADVAKVLGDLELEHAVIGGVALAVWSQPRTTVDLDFVLGSPREQAHAIAERLRRSQQFPVDPEVLSIGQVTIIRVHRTIERPSGQDVVLVDLLLFSPGIADEIMSRRVQVFALNGKSYWFCSAEDLIVMKLLASRPQDVVDALAVLERRGSKLDLQYVERTAASVGKSAVWQKLRKDWESP